MTSAIVYPYKRNVPKATITGLPAGFTVAQPSNDEIAIANSSLLTSNDSAVEMRENEANELLTLRKDEQNSEISIGQCEIDQLIESIVEPHQPLSGIPTFVAQPSCDEVTVANSTPLLSTPNRPTCNDDKITVFEL